MGKHADIYMKYPFQSTWRDVTSHLKIPKILIDERINTAGICTLYIQNADEWAENGILPGFQFRIFVYDYERKFSKPDFEGYVPSDFNPHILGVKKEMELPVVGYYDKHSRIHYTGKELEKWNPISAMFYLNSLVTQPNGNPWMEFQGEMSPNDVIGEGITYDINIKNVMREIMEAMIDSDDDFYPRNYHLVTTPQIDATKQPLLSLKKEPLLTDTPEIVIDWEDILHPVDVDDSDTFVSAAVIGEPENWSDKYRNENREYMQMKSEVDIRSKDDGGLKSGQDKGYTLYRTKDMGKSIMIRTKRKYQIPLLSSVSISNCPEVELQGNMIVYGKSTIKDNRHVTSLTLKSLPEEILVPS